MSEDDFQTLVAELVEPNSLARLKQVHSLLAEHVRMVIRGEKEAEGASERIWSLTVRQEAAKRAQAVTAA
ncbi:MAG: hypothetical protein AAFX06_10925 [Planctomycetota bacterium]